MIKVFIGDAIMAINPNAQVTVRDENLDTIEWNAGTTPISKADIQAKQAELKTGYDNKAYARINKSGISDQRGKNGGKICVYILQPYAL